MNMEERINHIMKKMEHLPRKKLIFSSADTPMPLGMGVSEK